MNSVNMFVKYKCNAHGVGSAISMYARPGASRGGRASRAGLLRAHTRGDGVREDRHRPRRRREKLDISILLRHADVGIDDVERLLDLLDVAVHRRR